MKERIADLQEVIMPVAKQHPVHGMWLWVFPNTSGYWYSSNQPVSAQVRWFCHMIGTEDRKIITLAVSKPDCLPFSFPQHNQKSNIACVRFP
jgi:hypothetical protein